MLAVGFCWIECAYRFFLLNISKKGEKMKGEYEGEEFDAFTFALRTSRKYIFAGMWSFLNKLQKLNKNRGTTIRGRIKSNRNRMEL